ncbi:M81 family metallopeptidase [Nitrospirillum sp. BR 11163]|uniref:M81 family metallopeptidase n=1 Tax=Nitrospirillum sp. BR 11163 TaxID=3104323 RepID=UPI002AFE0777|nr:M81 family metallopeptidase [Nitrospirillum sp. BR 11163]MEA1672726.1 M81 family metallopeptidase [Nitrospirillum sp. BR 11163]
MARIVVGGFQAEINSFYPRRTTFADFIDVLGRPYDAEAPVSLDEIRRTNWGIGGFCDEAVTLGHELVFTTWAIAQPAADVEDEAFDALCGHIVTGIQAALPADAVYLCLHGAMVTESHEDGDGEILRRVRAAVGDIPVVATLDLHANVTAEMVDLATALIVYRTYPHIDMADCGRQAARLLDGILRTGHAPAKAFRKIPFLIPPVWQCTTIEPARSIYAALAARQAPPLLSLSFAEGFPASDIYECGPAVLAYAQDQASAQAAADALHDLILSREADFAGRIYAPAEAVREAARLYDGRPVILADTQDNPGGGGSSDTVGVLKALVDAGAEDAALAILHDPAAAAAAHAARVGAELELALGAKMGDGRETPLVARFTVEAISDGIVTGKGPMMRGQTMRLGRTALLRTGGIRIVVASARMQPYDQEVLRHLGLDPAAQKILVLKSSVHFRNDFQDMAAAVLVVDSPGFNITDPRHFPYRRLRPDVRIAPRGHGL